MANLWVNDEGESGSLAGHLLDRLVHLEGHEAEDGENDESREDGRRVSHHADEPSVLRNQS